MPITLNEASALLKKDILPALVNVVKEKTLLYQLAQQKFKPRRLINGEFYVPVMATLSSGFTSYGITSIPSLNEGYPRLVDAQYTPVQYTQRFVIDKPTLDSGKGMVLDSLETQSRAAKDTLITQLNFHLYRDFSGGVILKAANNTGTGSSTTLELTEGRTVNNGDIDYALFLPPGTTIKIGTTNPVTVVAHAGKNTVTISAARSWSTGDNVAVLDGDGNPMVGLTGLLAAVGTGTYAGINSSTYQAWRSYVDTPNSPPVALALTDMDKAYLEASQFGKVDIVITNKTLFQKILAAAKSNPQWPVVAEPKIHLGWTAIEYNGKPLLLDTACPDDCVFFLSSDEIALAELSPLDFVAGNEGTLFKAYGKLAWEATLHTAIQLVIYNRRAHARLEGRNFGTT